jgi:ribulose-phosphate 3-epimerase
MSISRILADLQSAAPMIEPSLLACDFAELGQEIRRLEAAGAKMLHLDIMDGHFVPNLSVGVPVVEAVRRSTRLPVDVHLMVSEPARYVRAFREAGADLLTVHIETCGKMGTGASPKAGFPRFACDGSEPVPIFPDPRALLSEIRLLGAGAGIALDPPTPISDLDGCLDLCDLVLVMSVMPGFGGQAFEPDALERLRRLRAAVGPNVLLQVDGGINADTIGPCAEAGADLFVTGTALFSQDNYGRFIDEMTGLARSHKGVQV